MRLLRPSPGESVDRQTILMLKARYGEIKKVNTKGFTDEVNEIQEYLDKNWYFKLREEQGTHLNTLFQKLSDINNTLWKLEDEIRLRATKPIEGENKERICQIALLVPEWNDKRADAVQEINRLFLVVETEKIYLAK